MWRELVYLCYSTFDIVCSAVKRYDALAALGAAGMVDIQNLIKWIGESFMQWTEWLKPLMKNRFNSSQVTIFLFCFSPEQSHLDPNDPANADIMNIVKVIFCQHNCNGLLLILFPGFFPWPVAQNPRERSWERGWATSTFSLSFF